MLGDPLDAGTDVGPVITAESGRRIVAMIDAAVAEGATAATGGRLLGEVAGCEGGTFVAPTILTGVKPTPHGGPRGGVRPGARRSSRSTTSTRRSAS